MKVCLVSEEFPIETPKGGIATYQYILAKSLIKLGCEVFIICKTKKEDRVVKYEGIEIIYISYIDTNDEVSDNILYRKKVCEKMKILESKVDIFEVADWGAESHYYIKNRKKPLVIKLHTPFFVWNKYNKIKYTEKNNMIEKEEIEDIFECDSLYSCSESLKSLIKKELNYKKNIKVINNPIIYKEIKHENKKDIILFVGSLEERKGVFELARELNYFYRNNTKFLTLFIGEDTKRNRFQESTKKIIMNILHEEYHDKIKFLGHLKQEELFELYKKAKLAIFPSLYENFPYVLLEAMLNNCLCMGSIYGGMKEIITDGENGLLCNPKKPFDISLKMEKIFDNYDEYLKKVNNKKKLKKYDNLVIAKEVLKYYKNVIKKWEMYKCN